MKKGSPCFPPTLTWTKFHNGALKIEKAFPLLVTSECKCPFLGKIRIFDTCVSAQAKRLRKLPKKPKKAKELAEKLRAAKIAKAQKVVEGQKTIKGVTKIKVFSKYKQFKFASNYGIKPYNELKKITK